MQGASGGLLSLQLRGCSDWCSCECCPAVLDACPVAPRVTLPAGETRSFNTYVGHEFTARDVDGNVVPPEALFVYLLRPRARGTPRTRGRTHACLPG